MSCYEIRKDCFQAEFSFLHKISYEPYSTELHFHEPFEIYFCVRGGISFVIEDEIYSIEDGSLFIINDTEIHKPLSTSNGIYERMVILIEPTYLSSVFPSHADDIIRFFRFRKSGFRNKVFLSEEEQEIYKYLFLRIKALNNNIIGYNILRDIYYLELITFVMQKFHTNQASSGEGLFNPRILEVIHYINLNFQSHFTLDTLAAHVYLNKSYLCELFKQETGSTILEHLTAKRLIHAKRLLRDGTSVQYASEQSGFSSYSHFIRVFTKYFKQSPTQYKKSLHELRCISPDEFTNRDKQV